METFSANLFLASGWGVALSVVVSLAALGLGIASAIWVMGKLERAIAPLRYSGFFVALVGVPGTIFLSLPGGDGEVTRLALAEVDGERVIFADFTWLAGGGRAAATRHNASRRFRVSDGALLGQLESGGLFTSDCARATTVGRSQVCLDSLRVLDLVSFEETLDLREVLDARYGAEGYRVESAEGEALVVQRRDGGHETIPLAELGVAIGPLALVGLNGSCTVTAQRKDTEVEGLPRASVCALGNDRLVLHRESAFGEGEHRVSVQGPEGTRFTTSLRPWMVDDSDDLRLLAPAVREQELSLWLLREKVSLVEVVLDLRTGVAIRSDVVF